MAKVLEPQLSIRPSNEYPGLISFRIDWFDLLAVQETLKSLLSTTIQKHQFFSTQPSAVQETQVQFLGWKDPLQYFCLENPMVREDWQAIVHRVSRVQHNLVTSPPAFFMVQLSPSLS